MASTKICEGTLEKITETGTRFQEDWSSIPKGGKGTPRQVFAGLYSVLIIATNQGFQEKTYEGIILPDSLGHAIELYEQTEKQKPHGRGPFRIFEDEDNQKVIKRIQVYDKHLDRWYR